MSIKVIWIKDKNCYCYPDPVCIFLFKAENCKALRSFSISKWKCFNWKTTDGRVSTVLNLKLGIQNNFYGSCYWTFKSSEYQPSPVFEWQFDKKTFTHHLKTGLDLSSTYLDNRFLQFYVICHQQNCIFCLCYPKWT